MHGCFRRSHSRRGSLHLLFLALAVALASSGIAHAQGLRGKLADPISLNDLTIYEHLLQLSSSQRQALHHNYREYLEAYRALREGPVEEYLKAHPRAMTMHEIPDDPAVARKSAREHQKLRDGIRRIDEAFFDGLAPSLTESQARLLPRLRMMRQRQRYRQGPALVTRSPYLAVDLAALLDELDLTSDQRLAADPPVETYERNLLGALKELDQAASTMRLEIAEQKITRAEEAAEQGLWLEAIVIRAVFTRHAKLAGEIGDLHRRLCDKLTLILDEAALDELVGRFHAAVYPELAPSRDDADESLLAALHRDDLTDQQHEEVAACRDLFRFTSRRIREDMLDVIDALRLSTASHPLQLTMGDGDYYEDKQIYTDRLVQLDEDLDRANQDALQNLAVILGTPLGVPAADSRIVNAETLQPPRVITAVGSSRNGPRTYRQMRIPLAQLFLQFGAPIDGGPDRFIAPAIDEDDLDRYAQRLSLAGDDLLILAALHDAYLERYGLLEAGGAIADALEAQRAMFACGRDGKVRIPTASQVKTLFEVRRSASRQIIELDASFFTDVAVVWSDCVDPVLVQRLRNERLRAVYTLPRPSRLADRVKTPLLTFGEEEAKEAWIRGERVDIKLAALMNEIDCERQVRLEADAIVQAAELELTDLMRQLFEARFEMELTRTTIMARHLQRSDDGLFETTSITISRDIVELDKRIHRLLTDIRAANRACLSQVSALLPEAAAALECAYLRGGYPEVYADNNALHEILLSARDLDDLQPAQTVALNEISVSYRAEYERISRLITEAGRDQQARTRYSTERVELNNHTRVRLLEMLTPEQAVEIKLAE